MQTLSADAYVLVYTSMHQTRLLQVLIDLNTIQSTPFQITLHTMYKLKGQQCWANKYIIKKKKKPF